ncbi:MAG: membrane biogenesis protein, partial [Cyclobacteriaceae bacterium]
MKRLKLFLKIVAGFIGLFFLVLLTTVLLLNYNQKSLTQTFIENLNEGFNGELTLEDSRISLFKNFPYISIDLQNITFYGDKTIAGDTLRDNSIYQANDIYIGFDIIDIIKGNYSIKSLKIEGGHLNIVQYENGDINLMLAKGLSEMADKNDDAEEKSFNIDLKKLTLLDFKISRHDEASGQTLVFDIDDIETSFRMHEGHIYTTFHTHYILDIIEKDDSSIFREKHFQIDSELDYDSHTEILTITSGHIVMEDGVFGIHGHVDFDDDYEMDLKLTGDKPDFDLIIAFLPTDVAT